MCSRGLSRAAAFFLLGLLAADVMSAYYFRTQITLVAAKDTYKQPYVHSYAQAELFTDNGDRVYGVECILGHAVSDLTLDSTIFTARIVNSNGYLNSTTRDLVTQQDLTGEYSHCYGATLAAHANAYNKHQRQDSESSCIGPPPPEPPEKYTPILLDLETDGFHLSGPDPAVSFDLNADGTPERTAWTRAGEDDAFLCMDRNGNGVIDDGRELFGSATPLISGGTDESGYSALSEMDWPVAGGNSDGKIDADDPMFDRLCVWIDANRDGISQRREIRSLDQAGVAGFEGGYKTMHKNDDFGNLFRYTSRVYMRSPGGSVTSWPSFDVIFAVP
jgi:hypothetical protein